MKSSPLFPRAGTTELSPHGRGHALACSRCSISVHEINKTGENDSYLGETLLTLNSARKMPFELCFREKFAIRSSSDNQTKGLAGDLDFIQSSLEPMRIGNWEGAVCRGRVGGASRFRA